MKLTKHTHACVGIQVDGARLLIDPGTFTPDAGELLAQADAVLVTHDHFDHFDVDAIASALRSRPRLEIFGPSSIAAPLAQAGVSETQIHPLAPGQHTSVAGLRADVYGGTHASIHPDIATPQNLGYLVAETIYHPGDSYVAPEVPVEVLLVASSGPWTRVGEAIDFIRAVKPARTVPVHDIMLSAIGRRSVAGFLAEERTGSPFAPLEVSQSLDL